MQEISPMPETSKPSAISPKNNGLWRGCGDYMKSSMLCVMARILPHSNINGTVTVEKNSHGSSKI